MAAQKSLEASYYRGGTSRAVIFERRNLPADESTWPDIFLKILGSPDAYGRQLNGLGSGISSLSKVCVVAPSSQAEIDVDYTFFGIGIEDDEVDVAGNCGNMSAAIGPFALEHGLLHGGSNKSYSVDNSVNDTAANEVSVRIMNTNTQRVIVSTFARVGNEAATAGDFIVDGVAGSGAPIRLDFIAPSGAKTGALLPTGSVVDEINGMQVSCVDAGNPCVFVRAEQLGIDATILPADLLREPSNMEKLETLRKHAAARMGLLDTNGNTFRTIPKIAFVSAPAPHTLLSGKEQPADAVDVVVRFISDRQPHRAIPLTATICTAAAARLPGSVVNTTVSKELQNGTVLHIGHPSGRIPVVTTLAENSTLESVTVFRTARRLMEGKVFYS